MKSYTGALMATAMALSIASGTASAQGTTPPTEPVTIGVIDTRTEASFEGLDVRYRHFGVPTHQEGVERVTSKYTHGDLVIKSIADARTAMKDSRPYTVLVANPFVQGPEGRLLVNYKGLREAVGWFKEAGVRVVSTTFAATKDAPGMAAFQKAADEAGILVVASIGNGGDRTVPYPAAYKETLAVDGWHYLQKRSSTYDAVTARIDATFDGTTGVRSHPNGRDAREGDLYRFTAAPDSAMEVRGSSFAVPRATAFLAATLGPSVDLASAKSALAGHDRRAVFDLATARTPPSKGIRIADGTPEVTEIASLNARGTSR